MLLQGKSLILEHLGTPTGTLVGRSWAVKGGALGGWAKRRASRFQTWDLAQVPVWSLWVMESQRDKSSQSRYNRIFLFQRNKYIFNKRKASFFLRCAWLKSFPPSSQLSALQDFFHFLLSNLRRFFPHSSNHTQVFPVLEKPFTAYSYHPISLFFTVLLLEHVVNIPCFSAENITVWTELKYEDKAGVTCGARGFAKSDQTQ